MINSPAHTRLTMFAKAMLKAVPVTMAAILLTTPLLIAGAKPAAARTTIFVNGTSIRQMQQNDIGASAAAAAASAASGGRVLDVRRQSSRAGIIYRVKVLLPGGRVRSMTVDGQTGQVRG